MLSKKANWMIRGLENYRAWMNGCSDEYTGRLHEVKVFEAACEHVYFEFVPGVFVRSLWALGGRGRFKWIFFSCNRVIQNEFELLPIPVLEDYFLFVCTRANTPFKLNSADDRVLFGAIMLFNRSRHQERHKLSLAAYLSNPGTEAASLASTSLIYSLEPLKVLQAIDRGILDTTAQAQIPYARQYVLMQRLDRAVALRRKVVRAIFNRYDPLPGFCK